MRVAFELPDHLAEALKSIKTAGGPITVDMIKGVQAGDLHAADFIAAGLNEHDKATLIEAVKAAKLA